MKEHLHPDSLTKEVKKIDFWSWVRILIVVLLIIGAYAWGVIEGSRFSPRYGFDKVKYGRQFSEEYKKPNKDRVQMMIHDPMDMSMCTMEKMLDGKTGDDLDRAFLEAMIPHHQGAINMAKYLTGAKHDELKKLGAEIIAAQAKEIEQMQTWIKEWGYSATGEIVENTGDHCKIMPNMPGC